MGFNGKKGSEKVLRRGSKNGAFEKAPRRRQHAFLENEPVGMSLNYGQSRKNWESAKSAKVETKTLQPPIMDSVCLQKTRFHANPPLGTEPCKWQASPLVCMVQTPYFAANQPACSAWVLGASRCKKMGGLDSKPPILHKPCPWWAVRRGPGRVLEGDGRKGTGRILS